MISLLYPCEGPISQKFGENPLDYARYGLAGHNGIDIAVNTGTPIKAAEDGEITKCQWDNTGYGNYIKIEHKDITYGTYYTLYAHLSSYNVMVGQDVIKGQIIGYSGNTGNSTGPHLHFELELPWSNNISYKNRVDPLPYMEGGGTTTPTTIVQMGKAKVTATAGLNIRKEPLLYSESFRYCTFWFRNGMERRNSKRC